MNIQRWQLIFSVFEGVLERPPGERRAFLDQVCEGDGVLRRGVEELLMAHERGASFLDRPVVERLPGGGVVPDPKILNGGTAVDSGQPISEAANDSLPFQTVGPYRLLKQVGQGGMSTVYLATRADDAYHRQVVVKVVRSDKQSASLLRRLKVERQILANLEHPNIARLYDGGSTLDGNPYFVMEYVEGIPIDTYCEQNELSIDARLALFRKVCEALAYAHQNLVVHRDIKPPNILVTASGEPKLLDFGIAKLLNPSLAASELEPTAAFQRLMTPSYASPEQVRGEVITTVSDVYSLGVLLYLLLTRQLPYQFAGRSLRDIERLLTEAEPPKPSLAASGTEPTQTIDRPLRQAWPEPAVAAAAQTGTQTGTQAGTQAGTQTMAGPRPSAARNLPKLGDRTSAVRAPLPRRILAGDIDAIVLKALRSDPEQRYASVERFAADIERFQRGLPVAARAGSWRYRAGKFVRRHRRGVAAAALVVMTLVGFAIAMLLQARRVASERDKKAQVVSLILDIFRFSNPYVLPEAELTVREAFERSLPLIEERLREQPEVRGELLHTTGSILNILGFHARASEQLTEALEIRQRLYGAGHLEVAETMSALAESRKELAELDEAEELARQAVAITRDRLGAQHPDLVAPLMELASVLCFREDYTAAEPLASEALALAGRLPTSGAGEVAALEYLAQINSVAGDYVQAVDFNRRALELSREVYGERYPPQILVLNNLGLQLRRLSRFEEAQEVYERALQVQRDLFGDEHVDAVLINNLAGLRYASGDFVGAEAGYRDTLSIVEDRYGPDHWRVLFVGLRIAQTQIRLGALDAAEQEVRRLVARRLVADDHWLRDEANSLLGESLSLQGKCAESESMLVESFQRLLGKNTRERTRRDAFERLSAHLERCGKPQEVARYDAMLTANVS